MGELFASLDWPGAAAWAAFALASGAGALFGAWHHLVRAWHQRRLDRRLASNPYILREELNEYRFRIDDDLPPLDAGRLVGSGLLGGAVAAIPAWLIEQDLEHWWHYGHVLAGAVGLLYGIWRWYNDPPGTRGDEERQSTLDAFLAERDAVLGLCWAVVVVLLILAVVIAVF